jgi:hypothetical protein
MSSIGKYYRTFSGSDIDVYMAFQTLPKGNAPHTPANPDPNKGILRFTPLSSVQTISYSVFREKSPVRSLGSTNERGKARGTRTIAGSIVMTNLDRNPFFDAMVISEKDKNAANNNADYKYTHRMPDQLAPFDVIVHFNNEYGHSAELILYGMNLLSEGTVLSSENLITESTYQFTAGDMAIMRPGGYSDPNPKARAQGPTSGAKAGRNALDAYIKRKAEVAKRNASGLD